MKGGSATEAEGLHAAIYVRVSTRHQAEEGFSLEAQRDKLMAYVNQRGWTFELFEDAGVSGEKLDERPGLGRLLGLGSVVLRRQASFTVEETTYEQDECYFLVHADHVEVDDAGWTDQERRTIST